MAVTAVQVRRMRERLGLPADHKSDLVWHNRSWADMEDVTTALVEKRNQLRAEKQRARQRSTPVQGSDPGTPAVDNKPAIDQRTLDLVISSLGLPSALVGVFREEYIRSGKIELALAAVRQSKDYDTYYAGNRREDGTVRYSEAEYKSVIDAYAEIFHDRGLNADVYARKFGQLVAGDVSPQELLSRVDALSERIYQQPEEVRQAFASEFGINPSQATFSAILGVAVDPEIGDEVLNRRISISQVTGQARRFGYVRDRSRVENILNAGMDPMQAADFYTKAAGSLPRLGAYAGRYNEGQFGIEEFEDATLFGDTSDAERANRLVGREASMFSRAGQVRQDQAGSLLGLQQR